MLGVSIGGSSKALSWWAGVGDVGWLAPCPHPDIRYVAGDRGVVAAYVRDATDDDGVRLSE